MKMMKKSLAMLLAALIAIGISGTFVFAETTTPLTQFPAAPAESQMYVYYPPDSRVGTSSQPWYPVRGMTGSNFKSPRYSSGLFYVNQVPNANQWLPNPGGQEFMFESLETENASAAVSEGYLMIETKNITLKSDGHTENGRCAYGFVLESGAPFKDKTTGADCSIGTVFDSTLHDKVAGTRMAQVLISCSTGTNDYKPVVSVWDYNQTANTPAETMDASQWVKEGTAFNLKMLVNLDANTFDVYINDYPVLLSVKTADAAATQVTLIPYSSVKAKPADVKFGETAVYSLSDAAAAQCRQAAIEKALDCTFASDDEKELLFYTYGGTDATQADVYKKYFVDDTAYKNIECDGVSDLAITAEATDTNNRFNKVLLSGSNMTAYDYDNLEYVYVSNPVVDANNGTVSGTYELAGGKGITYNPVVITALYTDDTRKEMVRAVCADGSNGKYECTLGIEDSDPDGAAPSAFVWGGRTKLVPLFERIDFATIVQ